jgi:peptidoglycan hydrolase CwlO-like protein
MIHFKGKGEHSINELEAIIEERGEALHTKQLRIQDLQSAMQEFVNRVDKGEVRSKYTYAKFKSLLEHPENTTQNEIAQLQKEIDELKKDLFKYDRFYATKKVKG